VHRAERHHGYPLRADIRRFRPADHARVRLGLLPEQQCIAPLEEGVFVELAPGHPVDVPLYSQRWNLVAPVLDAVSAAVRDGVSAALRTTKKGHPQ